MKAGKNKLLIEVEKAYEDTITHGTLELYKDPMFNPTNNIRIHGVVKALPLNEDNIKDEWGTEIIPNIKVGDKAYFRYVAQENVTLRIEEYGKKDLISIQYSDVFCVVRDGEIIPCSGWCFGEPIIEDSGLKLYMDEKTKIISSIKSKKVLDKTKVLMIGTDLIKGTKTELEIGDLVCGFALNFENEIEGVNYYLFKEEDVHGKIEH
jgi:co-chaperonin GroES (HSP10)